MIRRTFLAVLCLIASIGIACAQDTVVPTTDANAVKAAAQSTETVTIPKSEFDALKDAVAQMRKELDALKGNQAQASTPQSTTPQAATQPVAPAQAAPATKSDADDASFESDNEPMPANQASPQVKPAEQTPAATEKEPANADEQSPDMSGQSSEGEDNSAVTEEQPAEAAPATTPAGGGKTLSLPDISLIGQAKTDFSTDKHDSARDTLRLSELELGIQGYVYPNVKADAFITASPQENSPFQVEEAYLTYLGLSKGLSLYVGDKHVPFGRTNLLHNHSWLYVNQPKVLQNLVGEESLGGEGADVSYLIPTNSDLFAQLDLGTWTIQGQGEQEETSLPNVVSGPGAAFGNHFNTARLWTSYPVREKSELELGGSYANGGAAGQAIPGYGEATLTGVDVSYRQFGEADQRLLLRGESVWRHEDADGLQNTVSGYYLFSNWKWDKDHSIGLLYDWSQFPQLAAQGEHESALSLIYTRQFSEQYYVRLEATHGYRPDDHSYNELWLQWVWGVGPHTHNLE